MPREGRLKIQDTQGMAEETLNLKGGWTVEVCKGLHGTVYHCYGKSADKSNRRPFSDVDRAELVHQLKKAALLSTVELINWEIMENHYHVILFAPAETLSIEEAKQRHDAVKKERLIAHPETLPEELRDLSIFMKAALQGFAVFYNKTRKDDAGEPVECGGAVFRGRFKSTVIDTCKYFTACLLYVTLNRVRPGIVRDPAESRHSMWGEWCRTGKCPLSSRAQLILCLHFGLPATTSEADLFEVLDRIIRLAAESLAERLRQRERARQQALASMAKAEADPKFKSSPEAVSPLPARQDGDIEAWLDLLCAGSLGKLWIRGLAVGSSQFILWTKTMLAIRHQTGSGFSAIQEGVANSSLAIPGIAGNGLAPPLFSLIRTRPGKHA